ncbi:hypothetical protein GGI02_002602 [Coemansia sp. RSA 2322]|nr:hypothetical protein GGI02_002602 [Coemansia sp. RSA 2322]
MMILTEAEAARRLRRHLVTRPAAESPGQGSQPRSYGSIGYSDAEGNDGYSGDDDNDDENNGVGPSRDVAVLEDVVVDPFTLPSGDITHHLYKWQEEHAQAGAGQGASPRNRHSRIRSLSAAPSDSEWDVAYTPNQMRAPGGFRRHFVHDRAERQGRPANILTANFVDFIGLYGHFAGGDYPSDEDDEEDEEEEEETEASRPPSEQVRLIRAVKRQQARDIKATASPKKAFFLLVKSFVGTGVLVLPRAFLNGGLIFSTILMSAIAWYALHCMILLSDVYLKLGGSYGDLALKLYGRPLKYCVMVSIVLAQLGFCCAYVIFVATNMRDLWNTVTDCKRQFSTEAWIVVQLLIYIPLAFVRKIKRFASLSMVGNVFILVGLGYLFFYDLWSISVHGPAKVVQFNPGKFPLLVGTAAFSYEGISLVIPIVESMERKDKFNSVLTASLVICAAIFVTIGFLSYLTFGEAVEAVILLNLPNDSMWTIGVQFLYSLAIIMSVPLQLFPAIRIIESGLFTQSGKGNPTVKWQKNLFRTLMVGFIALVAIFGADKLDNFIAIVPSQPQVAAFAHWQDDPHGQALSTAPAAHLQSTQVHDAALAPAPLQPQVPSQPQVATFAHWQDDPHGQAAAAGSFLVEQHDEAGCAVVPQHDFGASSPVAQLVHEHSTHSHLPAHLQVLQLESAGQVHSVAPGWPQVHEEESHSPAQAHLAHSPETAAFLSQGQTIFVRVLICVGVEK